MKIGIDISHWNKDLCIKHDLTQLPFIAIKATEGKSFIDPKGQDYLIDYASRHAGIGKIIFYHFAHIECNSAEEEANHFISTVNQWIDDYNKIDEFSQVDYMYALDVEAQSLLVSNAILNEWIDDFSKRCMQEWGGNMILYVSASVVKRLTPLLQKMPIDLPFLWVAHYAVKEPKCYTDVRRYGMWQFTSMPFDVDIMYDIFINNIRKFLIERT